MKEIMYIKVQKCTPEDKMELFPDRGDVSRQKCIDYGKDSVLLEFVQTGTKNDAVSEADKRRVQVVLKSYRGGSVGIERSHARKMEK